jgi:hypothetical protein
MRYLAKDPVRRIKIGALLILDKHTKNTIKKGGGNHQKQIGSMLIRCCMYVPLKSEAS